jgi:hypothetical protein
MCGGQRSKKRIGVFLRAEFPILAKHHGLFYRCALERTSVGPYIPQDSYGCSPGRIRWPAPDVISHIRGIGRRFEMKDHLATLSTLQQRRRPDWAPRFIEVFATTGNVSLAAGAAGVSRAAPYKRAGVSLTFAQAWLQAREEAVDILEAEARRRALATSDTLLMFLLKAGRPEKYRERVDIKVDMRQEAARIAAKLGIDPDAAIAEAERILEEAGM